MSKYINNKTFNKNMKIYNLTNYDFELKIDQCDINKLLNKQLYNKIINKKSEIDKVTVNWDKAKKVSNNYEYIYTSSNIKKNISSMIPVSRSFFKLREIIYDFNLSVNDNCACIAEAPGGFIQSLLRHIKEKQININKIHGITLISEDKDVPYWNPILIKDPNVRLSNGYDGTGDIYKLKNILKFIKDCGNNSCSIVTADGGFDYTSNFEQELSSYKLFYSEIMISLHIQKQGGTFICKLFDLFYLKTIKLIYILYLSYDMISFIKPLTSRCSNSEKYIVCCGFKGYNKTINNMLCSYFDEDSLPCVVPDKFINMIDDYHNKFIDNQIKNIDNTLNVIKKNIYYDKPMQSQIRLAKEWCNTYKIPLNKKSYYF